MAADVERSERSEEPPGKSRRVGRRRRELITIGALYDSPCRDWWPSGSSR